MRCPERRTTARTQRTAPACATCGTTPCGRRRQGCNAAPSPKLARERAGASAARRPPRPPRARPPRPPPGGALARLEQDRRAELAARARWPASRPPPRRAARAACAPRIDDAAAEAAAQLEREVRAARTAIARASSRTAPRRRRGRPPGRRCAAPGAPLASLIRYGETGPVARETHRGLLKAWQSPHARAASSSTPPAPATKTAFATPDRALPRPAARALLPHARLGARRRGRAAGGVAARVARPSTASRAAARSRSWLYTIATNTCLNQIARRPKRVLPVDYAPGRRPPRRPG